MNDQQQMIKDVLKILLSQGATGSKRVGREGKRQLDIRNINVKRDKLYLKLGKEVEQLIKLGELEHPGLLRAIGHLKKLEEELEAITKSTQIVPKAD